MTQDDRIDQGSIFFFWSERAKVIQIPQYFEWTNEVVEIKLQMWYNRILRSFYPCLSWMTRKEYFITSELFISHHFKHFSFCFDPLSLHSFMFFFHRLSQRVSSFTLSVISVWRNELNCVYTDGHIYILITSLYCQFVTIIQAKFMQLRIFEILTKIDLENKKILKQF